MRSPRSNEDLKPLDLLHMELQRENPPIEPMRDESLHSQMGREKHS